MSTTVDVAAAMERRAAAPPTTPAAAVRARPSSRTMAVVGAGLAGLAAVAVFDVRSTAAFNDEWVYAWSVTRLAGGHGLHLFPEQWATGLVGILWGWAATLGHPDLRWLRLAILPFLVLAAVASFTLARRLGADRVWSATAAAALVCSPLTLAVTTGFMTDTVYLGLMLAAMTASVRWIRDGRGAAWCTVLIVLATLERQHGIGLAVATAIAAVVQAPPSHRRRAIPQAGVLVAAAFMALRLPDLVGLATPMQHRQGISLVPPPWAANTVAFTLVVVGLVVLPLAVRLVAVRRLRRPGVVTLLGVVGAATGLLLVVRGSSPLPGDVLSTAAVNPVTLTAGTKPPLVGGTAATVVEVLLVLLAAAVVVGGDDTWRPRSVLEGWLLGVAATQLGVMVVSGSLLDRYYLPVAAPLLVLAAVRAGSTDARASRSHWMRRLEVGWAAGVLLAGVAVYAVGEHDYQSWQDARAQAARMASSIAPPSLVNAGYEQNAVDYELPHYDATGLLYDHPPDRDLVPLPALAGPRCPRVVLAFASADDPRPGVTYRSAAPGRIVVVRVERPAC